MSELTYVKIVVCQNDASHSYLLEKHAPLPRFYVVDRAMNEWMTDYMLAL